MMLLWENIILAVNGLLSNKTRAFLTMLGIIIGIGSVIAIITVGNSLTLSLSEDMQSMGANDVYVMLEPRSDEDENGSIDGVVYGTLQKSEELKEEDYITTEMIDAMCEKYPNEVYAINLQHTIGQTSVAVGKKSASVNVSGVSAGYFVTNKLEMLHGAMLSASDFAEGKNAILVADKLVEDLFDGDAQKALGSEIEINCNNSAGSFTIVGVYKHEQNAMMGMSFDMPTEVYMPLKTANNFDHLENNYSSFQVVTKVGVNSDEFGKIAKIFRAVLPQ